MTNAAAATSRLLAYARVSTDEQATTGVSLSAQRERIESYVRLYGGELIDVVVDAGVSAKTLRRPGLERLLQQLDEGEADGVVVAKLDRLTRSVRDLGDLVEKYFAEGRFVLLSVGEQIDTRSAGGRLVLNLLASVSQWERETIGERTKVALQHLQAQGAHIGVAAHAG
ncbi:recombinase family protein [Candidatus Binatia bacterium]|nr:recombinase family protein [Candidatus Binatia bacterium]